jgi:hypothetical protein
MGTELESRGPRSRGRTNCTPGGRAGARRVLALALAVTAAWTSIAMASDENLRVYRWVDDQGVVHYGDSVPPQYADDAHDVLNGEGVQISHVAGLGSAADQRAAAAAAAAAAQRAAHDKFLLQTYASTQEIEQLRDERLQQIEGQIKASSSYIDSLTLRLAALQERAMNFAPYSSNPGAARMPDELAVELVRTLNEARMQRNALAAKRQEQIDTTVQFAADIERFRELTTHASS